MGLFGKRVSDAEWVTIAEPLYSQAAPICERFRSAMATDTLAEEEVAATGQALSELLRLHLAIKALSSPTSSGANDANKGLEKGVGKYHSAAKQAAKLIQSLQGGLGERAQLDGMAGRAAMGRVSIHQARVAADILSAWQEMGKAELYFDRA